MLIGQKLTWIPQTISLSLKQTNTLEQTHWVSSLQYKKMKKKHKPALHTTNINKLSTTVGFNQCSILTREKIVNISVPPYSLIQMWRKQQAFRQRRQERVMGQSPWRRRPPGWPCSWVLLATVHAPPPKQAGPEMIHLVVPHPWWTDTEKPFRQTCSPSKTWWWT